VSSAPRLVIVTERARADEATWLERLSEWLPRAQLGSVLVQLRDRQLEAAERLAFGLRLRELTRQHGQKLAVNDRLDLALLVAADAVHLPESGLPAAVARRWLERHRADWLVSVACHDPSWLPDVAVDALLLSPLCAPRKGRPALGLAGLRAAVHARALAQARHHIYALGGVGADEAPSLLAAGADGVAVIGAVFDARGPEPLLAALGILKRA
jgi:thiamine-phosphate pyrophosphorylase